MRKIIPLLLAVVITGCASNPSISELNIGFSRVDFVQMGRDPMIYSLGVVDTNSFWATYGDDVAVNLGGSALFSSVQAGAAAEERKRQPTAADVMRALVAGYPMTDNLTQKLLPQVAARWGYSYRESDLKVSNDLKPAVSAWVSGEC